MLIGLIKSFCVRADANKFHRLKEWNFFNLLSPILNSRKFKINLKNFIVHNSIKYDPDNQVV